MSNCVEIPCDEVSLLLKSPFPKRVTVPNRLVDKCAEAAVARNVTPHKTLARERAQNKTNECYSRLFCSFFKCYIYSYHQKCHKIKVFVWRTSTGQLFFVVVTSLQSADLDVKELSVV